MVANSREPLFHVKLSIKIHPNVPILRNWIARPTEVVYVGSNPAADTFFTVLKRASWGLHFCNLIGNRLKWALRGAFGSRGISKYRY